MATLYWNSHGVFMDSSYSKMGSKLSLDGTDIAEGHLPTGYHL